MSDVLGEYLGTTILILLGDGVVAAVLLTRSKAKDAGWLVITTAWAFAVFAGVATARAVGGNDVGYINPVGPIVGIVNGTLAIDRALLYILAEMAGAFTGGVLVWLHYWPHWQVTDDPTVKLGVFCTAPAIRHAPANVLSEVIGTFVLIFVGAAIAKGGAPGYLGAPFVGMLVWSIGLSLGATTGYAINPARDFGPRCAHALLPIAGKGGSDWSYAWIPIVGPILGAILAAITVNAVIPV